MEENKSVRDKKQASNEEEIEIFCLFCIKQNDVDLCYNTNTLFFVSTTIHEFL